MLKTNISSRETAEGSGGRRGPGEGGGREIKETTTMKRDSDSEKWPTLGRERQQPQELEWKEKEE
eukprot:980102-Pyramimonas_sp.AAC.1